jgi:hypothetical protein
MNVELRIKLPEVDFQNLYKHGRVCRAGLSPNKGSSLYTFHVCSVSLVCLSHASYRVAPLTIGPYCSHRSMRTFNNFSLLAVLSCIAMIGATLIGNRAPAGAIHRRQLYVP